ncbi:MAG: sodium-dependent transporter, partial [Chlamydiae bacterium]|nr:sodium-dependent transporter [Chlamydiota bacterium]
MHPREHWSTRIGFIMAAAGSAIGLGSLWRFPYTVGENGGAAFVLLYALFTFFLGLPVFISELVVGRNTQKSAVFAYQSLSHVESNWKMLGYLNILSCFIILAFYSVVSGWCLSYTLMSLTQFTQGKTPEEIKGVFNILASSPGINLFWLFLFLGLNVGVVFSGVKKGIEHWSKILMPILLVLLLFLFGYSLTLEGFPQAFEFIMKPDFSKLTPAAILNALGMAFFTLSVGLGIILTYGSYMGPKEDIPKTSFIVATMTFIVSMISALMIFPIVFTFGLAPEGGPGLVFQTLPILFAKLPGEVILSTIFFSLLFFTAITSSISLLEMLVANFMEIFLLPRKKATIYTALITFIIGIPCALSSSDLLFANWKAIYGKDFFETMNYLTSSWMMPISGLLSTIFVGWKMEKRIFESELLSGTKMTYLLKPIFFSVKWLAPIS